MSREQLSGMQRDRRKRRVRKKIMGDPARPRLSVFRSHRHIYGQIVDDLHSKTLAAASSKSLDLKDQLKHGGNVASARKVGELLAKQAMARGVRRVVFDRNGYLYHGRIKALADAAREAGLEF